MKKLITVFIVIALCTCIFTGCSGDYVMSDNEDECSMFVSVEYVTDQWRVVCHKDTKVMYVISYGSYNRGTFTVLLNPDGTPMIWED